MSEFNTIPNFPVALTEGRQTKKEWYFFWNGLFRGLPPEKEVAVTLTGSPYLYSAAKKGPLIVSGGTVSAIAFSRDGVTFYNTGAVAGMFTVNASDRIRITYTVAPAVTFVPT